MPIAKTNQKFHVPLTLPKKLVDMKTLYKEARIAYYESDLPIMTDAEFDRLEDAIRSKDPKWAELAKTGVKPAKLVRAGKKVDIELPKLMPSLNKFYPEAIGKWLAKQKQPPVVLPKYDGTSLLLKYTQGRPTGLYTRGDGVIGKDVSFLIPGLNLPTFKSNTNMYFRVEALLPKSIFEKKYKKRDADDKRKDRYDNSRNLVNGLFNRTVISPELKDVHVVVLGQYGFPIIEGLQRATRLGFHAASVATGSTALGLSKMLAHVKEVSDYELDGLVLVPPNQKFEYENSDKPKWTVAFKANTAIEEADETTVKAVIWQTSHRGRLIPKVEVEPVRIGGATVKFCTVNNAKWMHDRGLGPGAVVKIVRSGDVIPKIVKVVSQSRKKPMPDQECEWKGVHLVATTASREQGVRQLQRFVTTLGVEHAAGTTLGKLYDMGVTSTQGLMEMFVEGRDEFIYHAHEVAGIGKAMSGKFYDSLKEKTNPIQLVDLLVGSSCFDAGWGHRRFNEMAKHMPLNQIIVAKDAALLNQLTKIKGFGEATAKVLLEGRDDFLEVLRGLRNIGVVVEVPTQVTKPVKAKTKQGILTGQVVTFTGYRDQGREEIIAYHGGEVLAFGSKTTVLIYRPDGKKSSKIAKAGDKAMTWEEFARKFKIPGAK